MNETIDEITCFVCGLNPGTVYSSGLGPVSYPRCDTCLDKGAEDINVICLTLYYNGGPLRVAESSEGNWWRQNVRTFLNGRYVGWPEIVNKYPELEAKFKADDDLPKLKSDDDAL